MGALIGSWIFKLFHGVHLMKGPTYISREINTKLTIYGSKIIKFNIFILDSNYGLSEAPRHIGNIGGHF